MSGYKREREREKRNGKKNIEQLRRVDTVDRKKKR
jgi:hypothetical protein